MHHEHYQCFSWIFWGIFHLKLSQRACFVPCEAFRCSAPAFQVRSNFIKLLFAALFMITDNFHWIWMRNLCSAPAAQPFKSQALPMELTLVPCSPSIPLIVISPRIPQPVMAKPIPALRTLKAAQMAVSSPVADYVKNNPAPHLVRCSISLPSLKCLNAEIIQECCCQGGRETTGFNLDGGDFCPVYCS